MILIWSRVRLLPSVVFFTTLITIFIRWSYFSLDERLTFLTVRLQPLVDFFTPLIIFFIGGALDIPYSVTPALGGLYFFTPLIIFFIRYSYFSLEEHSTFLIVWLLVAGLPGDYYGWRPPTAATYMGFPRAMQKCKEKMKSQKYENTRAENKNEEALSI